MQYNTIYVFHCVIAAQRLKPVLVPVRPMSLFTKSEPSESRPVTTANDPCNGYNSQLDTLRPCLIRLKPDMGFKIRILKPWGCKQTEC